MAERSLFLVGYRGSGKTSVGRMIAERIDRPFFDCDALIEERAGCSIAEVFERDGEDAFRELEEAVVRDVAAQARRCPTVVSTGGGAILRESNVRAMQDAGLVVWLDASVETLRRRIDGDAASGTNRPALRGASAADEVESVLSDREPKYRAASHHRVETDARDVEDIAAEIIARL